MSRLSTRLAKLEAKPGGNTEGQWLARQIAVVESPFPTGDGLQWAVDLRQWLNSDADLVVLEGAERKIVLPPSPREGEAEQAFIAAENTYPNISVCEFIGQLIVARWDSGAERQEAQHWVEELDRMAKARLAQRRA